MMTKTCDGSGAADGSGVWGGAVTIACEGEGDAGAWAEGFAEHAARTKAHSASATNLMYDEPTKQGPVKLQRDPWEIVIRPERGGRITSLRLRGEELLEQGIGVDVPTAEGFVEAGAWGWDEMVPNLEATDSLPDHGEAWRLPWTVDELGVSAVVMRCRGRLMPWELERRVALDSGVSLSYRYTNPDSREQLAYWCAHPLFKLEAGMDVAAGLAAVAEGKSAKVFLPKGSVDHVTLRWRSGAAVEMSWDAALTPNVAIWVCNGDLGGYRQIAIEPATDSPVLAPGGSLEWWLRVRDETRL